ncbi:MAG TPA: DUF1579 domain-containing protein [Devosiaceae bacterium]|jgi:hypothetical protein
MNYHAVNFAAPTGDPHDFDFLHGDWVVTNRRLKQRWTGCTDWEVFTGYSHCTPYLGGGANVEEMDVPSHGFSGLSMRLYDHESRRWAIYWINSRQGTLFPPVHGGFMGDHGVFVGRDEDRGEAVTVQFFWTRLDARNARWSQAFSRDGIIWETNWIMEFKRLAP